MNTLITKLNLRRSSFVAALLMVASLALSQVTGTVTDESGEGLAGATVRVQNGTAGAITGIDGQFSIDAPSNANLIVSFIGYDTQIVPVDGNSNLNIQMAVDATSIENVVVVGYGTANREELTSSVASVKPEDFNSGNVTNPSELIQGKVAGLSISRPGGNPNEGFDIRLRGLTTFGGSTSPLILIDGIPAASLDEVEPQDIASMDVLKDGSAAAIYGVRASSGVILITTKKGTDSRTKVSYSGQGSVSSNARTVDVADAGQYRTLPSPTDFGGSTDWFDVISQSGLSHKHGVSIAGGNGQTNYRTSFNYTNTEGNLITTGFNRFNVRGELGTKVANDRLSIDGTAVVTRRNSSFGFTEANRYAALANPTQPVYDAAAPDGDGYMEVDAFDYFNPLAILEQNVNEGKLDNFKGSVKVGFDLLDNLNISQLYSLTTTSFLGGEHYSRTARFRGEGTNGLATRREDAGQRQFAETVMTFSDELMEDRMGFQALGGYSFEIRDNTGLGVTAGDFVSDDFGYNNLGGSKQLADGLASVYSYNNQPILKGWFGRLNFDLDDIYNLSLSGRYEGSNQFGADERFGFFPAISAGVDIAKAAGLDNFDLLKLRAGWGKTGNLPPGDAQLYNQLWAPSGFFPSALGSFSSSLGLQRDANPGLKWETKDEINIGVDFGAVDGRLNGSLDFYDRSISDLVLQVPNTNSDAIAGTWFDNVGSISSNGLELLLDFAAVDNGSFSWNPTLTTNYYLSNTLDVLDSPFNRIGNAGSPGNNDTPTILLEEGGPLGQIWGATFEGIDAGGNPIFADTNGDGGYVNVDDNTVIGSGTPDVELGFSNNFTFGDNWDASFFLRGVFGHDLVNLYRFFYENGAPASYNRVVTDNFDPNLTVAPNSTISTKDVEDGDFVRLDNLTVGYTPNITGDVFENARLFLTGQNLLTLTGYSGVDPEIRWTDGGDGRAPGIDRRNVYATARTFSLGVNFNLN